MRITILGLPGSGKSTLARRISDKQGIPHIHIDTFWKEGGGGHNRQTTPNPEQTHAHVRAEVMEAIQQESWVSDGVYPPVQSLIAERADTMIFLDTPLYDRLRNQINRTLRSIGGKSELSFWSNVQFFFEMLHPDLRSASRIQGIFDMYQGQKVTLRSRRDIAEYLGGVG